MNQILFIIVSIAFFLLSITDLQISLADNKVVTKSLKCKNYNNYFHNLSCKLKPLRNGPGNITITTIIPKPVKDLWVHMIVYYKFRVFQKFMITLDINLCELFKKGTVI